ncbi:MAG: 50S ribosomal protein L23, partial [Muribaculaceae bacterium]|nr:50S ribosomal protein L23 [Muribaculaceae bacterium]
MAIKIIPVVTEKANAISEKGNRFTFKVSPDANKYQIISAIEQLYDVKVTGISTMNYDGKKKQRYTKSG